MLEKAEAKAFDCQIMERIENGHVPDLRYTERNEWFYNNVWRDPEFVKMSFSENLAYLMQFLKPNSKVLEIGCGPGHMSLELARNGHNVTGIDLSPKCIEVAKHTAANNIYRKGFGSLEYYRDDFLEMNLELGSYDSVMFYGALSHFPDIDKTLDRVSELLVPKGLILVWDTSVELYTKEDAGFLHFTRMLLSYCGNYYETKKLPKDANELDTQITQVLNELQYVDDDGENLQSPNDNSQTFASMMDAIEQHFDERAFCWESCFYRNIIAGLRFDRPEKEHMLAKFIKQMESFFISQGRLNPAFFHYVGEKKRVL